MAQQLVAQLKNNEIAPNTTTIVADNDPGPFVRELQKHGFVVTWEKQTNTIVVPGNRRFRFKSV